MIFAEIPIRLPTLNEWQRMHWAKRSRLGKRIAVALFYTIQMAGLMPNRPLKRCAVRVERVSTKAPDPDGLVASCKPLLDALQPASKRHPYGIGVIAEDNAQCITRLDVEHVPGKASKTRVWIEEVA